MKKAQDFKVKETRWLNSTSYILVLGSDSSVEDIAPGNFAELKVPEEPDVFLRRPISVYDVNYDKKTISYYIKAIGKGTRKLGALREGSVVNSVYPLGNSFTEIKNKRVLVVGGGSGIAPFKLLAERLVKDGTEVSFLFGARTSEDIVLEDVFSNLGNFFCTTEDGSKGEKGMVTQHSLFNNIKDFDMVYTCGPDPMMKAVASLAAEKGIDCEVSLENMMACGFGACLCCVTPTVRGNECVCTEGPVFKATDLKW